MDKLCTDVGYASLNKHGELLCGDHVEIASADGRSTVLVLADGLGSGVKASILSTLTSKMLATMLLNGLTLRDSVATVASTLPTCSVRQLAYSTFTVIRARDNAQADMIQYDNPQVILLRDGRSIEYPRRIETFDGKTIHITQVELQENDTFVAISDGVVHAGVGRTLNFGWQREQIVSYLERVYRPELTAKSLSGLLVEACNELYGGAPGDDTTVCTLRIRPRRQISLCIGPPLAREDDHKMMALFFAKQGKHIVCGGTTSEMAGRFLNKPVVIGAPEYADPDIPPTARIEGIDLVTEGVITINRVLEHAQAYLRDAICGDAWRKGRDGASRIARLLFEEATDIDFYVGRAVNPAHQNPDLPIGFNIKMRLIEALSECLQRMGKRIKVSYF